MPGTSINLMANGNIIPARFVKLDTANDDYGLQATDGAASHGDPVIGISGQDTDQPPLSDLISTFYHAIAGEPIRLYGPGEVTLVEIGAAVTTERRLKSDSVGRAIPVTSDADFVGAIALETGATAGMKIRVVVAAPSQMTAA